MFDDSLIPGSAKCHECDATQASFLQAAEAKTEVTRAVELLPDLSITEVLTLIPMKHREVTERYARLLNEAGLPE